MQQQYKSASDFYNNKKPPPAEKGERNYVLTNYKRKNVKGDDILALYTEYRIPFDLDVVKLLDDTALYDKLKSLMEESAKENNALIEKLLPLKKEMTTQVVFSDAPFNDAIKVSYINNINPEFLTIDELKVLGPQDAVFFEANPLCVTDKEYQLLYILSSDILIISKEHISRREWILEILQKS